jgi:hypothetical protein
MKTIKINKKYLPKILTKKDHQKQVKMLIKSRKNYKKGIYYTRKKVSSFNSKKSSYIKNAIDIYKIPIIDVNTKLVKASGCSKNALKKIIRKGEGAYYSSGSRPNQTPQSWGKARLASALTSGKAAVIDYDILKNGCKPNSKALQLAKKAIKMYGHKLRHSLKTNL